MDAEQRQQWQIGELARRTGVSVRALRHYDDLGLLTPSARTAGGYRLYGEADVQRLYRIVALRQLEFSLEQIAGLLDDSLLDLAETVRRHLHRVERDLQHHKRLRGRLAPIVRALAASEQPSVDVFIDATEVMSVSLDENQWEELFHPDTLYFEEQLLSGERSDRDVDVLTRLLELSDAAEILDAPCGWGRHTNRLAARGYRMTGLDNNRLLLDRARQDATATGAHADYVEGDLRALPFPDAGFDAVLNWRTSFGFFDEDGNQSQLREFARVLRPGGRLAMDLHNHDDLVRRMPDRGPLINLIARDEDLLIERVHLDATSGRSRTERIVVRDGRTRRFGFSLAIPPLPVLHDWLRHAGFHTVDAFDGNAARYASTAAASSSSPSDSDPRPTCHAAVARRQDSCSTHNGGAHGTLELSVRPSGDAIAREQWARPVRPVASRRCGGLR